jgi:hypothetical protein
VRDLGSLLSPDEQKQALDLLGYYVDQRLRGAASTADCRTR